MLRLVGRKMQGPMTRSRHLGLILALAALASAGCGGDEDDATSPATTGPEVGAEAPATSANEEPAGEPPGGSSTPPPPEGKPSGPAESGAGDPRVTRLEREAERAVRAFVAALDDRDGEAACALLEPGALDQIELPERRAGCAASLEASIGHRDQRGLPVWEGAEIARISSVEIDGEAAKVVATVVTRFADRDEPSIEDDVVYLTRAGDGWVLAKPSATLYRAVGIADIPLSVLAPPG
jgi:hypothetical protein